jgi:hypothetical protein
MVKHARMMGERIGRVTSFFLAYIIAYMWL